MMNKCAVAVPQIPRIPAAEEPSEVSCDVDAPADQQPPDLINNECIPAESMPTISAPSHNPGSSSTLSWFPSSIASFFTASK